MIFSDIRRSVYPEGLFWDGVRGEGGGGSRGKKTSSLFLTMSSSLVELLMFPEQSGPASLQMVAELRCMGSSSVDKLALHEDLAKGTVRPAGTNGARAAIS